MSAAEMEATARAYRELQNEIKALEEEAEALKQRMIREMDARQVEKLPAGAFTVNYTVYASARLDSAKLRAEQPELYASYAKETTACRFQVA